MHVENIQFCEMIYLPTAGKIGTGKGKRKVSHQQTGCRLMAASKTMPFWNRINSDGFRRAAFILKMRNQRLQNNSSAISLAKTKRLSSLCIGVHCCV